VGIGETDYVRGSVHSPLELMLQASRTAIADAGLKPRDIDAILPPPGFTTAEELAAQLGIDDLRFSVTSHMGGASMTASLQVAAMAITSGVADTVLITLAGTGSPRCARRRGRQTEAAPQRGPRRLRQRQPVLLRRLTECGRRADVLALPQRYKELYNVPDDAAAAVALAARKHAHLNPKALMAGRELTMQEYSSHRC